MFKSVIWPSILVSLTIFMIINAIYAAAHYAFGFVVIPEWYKKDNESFEPIPITPFIYYWIKRGLILSFIYGVMAFILTFIFTMFKYRKTKDIVHNG